MKKVFSSLLLTLLVGSFVFSAAFGPSTNKVPAKQKGRLKVEKMPTKVASESALGNAYQPTNRNGSNFTLIDSSQNGYGLVVQGTRPIYVDGDNIHSVYRQYRGVGGTHGQLGASQSVDGGESWERYTNINQTDDTPNGAFFTSYGGARYPSSLGNEDYPYAFWNEYSALWQTVSPGYGGYGHYVYDEFGWGAQGSYTDPTVVDFLWDGSKDQWTGSPARTNNNGVETFNIVYADWTRDGYYSFHSEDYDDGFIVFSTENLIFDEVRDFVGGTEDGSYNGSPVISFNEDGVGAAGMIALFNKDQNGVDCDPDLALENDCYHTFVFKMSDDHGATWSGGGSSFMPDYHYIPNEVFEHMIDNAFGCEGYDGQYYDVCGDSTANIVDMWSYYEYDMRIDKNGDPHIVLQILPCDDEFCYYGCGDGSNVGAGYYYFTIDGDYLSNPGAVNSATGWNYSQIVNAYKTWAFGALDGESMLWQATPSISVSSNNADNVFVTINMATNGPAEDVDESDPNDCVEPYESFPEWSQDIYVFKSEDKGSTWWNPLNASQTPDLTLGENSPEEEYPHAYHWSTDDEVHIMYQMPNWAFNEIGDPLGADHMNYVYVGTATLTSDSEDPYGADNSCSDAGDANGDGGVNILDVVATVNFVLTGAGGIEECAADFNGDGGVNILDVVGIVNFVLTGGKAVDDNATSAQIEKTDRSLNLYANGYVGAVQVTLHHEKAISVTLTDDCYVPAKTSSENSTTIIIVEPYSNKIADIDGEYEIGDVQVANSTQFIDVRMADRFALLSSYPNPFNPQTTISYELFVDAQVELGIYNILGQQVAVIDQGLRSAGTYSATWNGKDAMGSDVSSGLYIMKLTHGNNTTTGKITLLR